MILPHDKSACKWSAQKKGYCPYDEMLSKLVSSHTSHARRCETKECLFVELGVGSEHELVSKHFPELAKPSGPLKREELLSNINIDAVLHDFALASVGKKSEESIFKNGPFFHVPFDMRDFDRALESVFRDLNLEELVRKGFKSFGCVLNTDTWSSPNNEGHWVAVYGQFAGPQKCVIEYFNSSGNGLAQFREIQSWIDKKKYDHPSIKISHREVVDEPLQGDDTVNCGVWCLLYIKSRLEGRDPKYFYKCGVNDDFVDEARKFLFSK